MGKINPIKTAKTPFMVNMTTNAHPLTVAPEGLLPLCADMATDLPQAVRLQRLVDLTRAQFSCGAVALLRLEEDRLRPVAVTGLVSDAGPALCRGPAPAPGGHPGAARGHLLRARQPAARPLRRPARLLVGEPLPVHDCMGVALWRAAPGAMLTLDALTTGTFSARRASAWRAACHGGAVVRMARLEHGCAPAHGRHRRHWGDDVLCARPRWRRRGRDRRRKPGPQSACCTSWPWSPNPTYRCCCWARPASAKSCSRACCTSSRAAQPAHGACQLRGPARIAGRERTLRPCARRVLGRRQRPAWPHRGRRGRHAVPWTKWASCPVPCRQNCCARCKTARSSAWAPTARAACMCASSPPPTATCARSPAAPSAPTSTTACRSTLCPSPLRERGNDDAAAGPAAFWS